MTGLTNYMILCYYAASQTPMTHRRVFGNINIADLFTAVVTGLLRHYSWGNTVGSRHTTASKVGCEIIWMRDLFDELGYTPVPAP